MAGLDLRPLTTLDHYDSIRKLLLLMFHFLLSHAAYASDRVSIRVLLAFDHR